MRYPYKLLLVLVICLLGLVVTASAQDDSGGRPTGGTYVLQYGDTLDVLAQEWDISLVALQQANGITGATILRAGDTLIIPGNAPAYGVYPPLCPDETGRLSVTVSCDDPGRGGGGAETYVVQPGDTVDGLAQRFNVSVVSLRETNNITNTRMMMAGQVLVIPADAPPYGTFPASPAGEESMDSTADTDTTAGQGGGLAVSGDSYVVQPLDTLETIAQRFDVSLISLRQANQITGRRVLMAGDTLVIPEGAPPYGTYPPLCPDETGRPSVTASCDDPGQGGGGAETYVVQVGNTVDGIAAHFNIQAACLIESNNLPARHYIYAGQVLVIDESCPPYDGFDVVGRPLNS